MKKTTLRQAAMKLAIVAIALFAPLGLRTQETLTVCDGTSTNEYVPFYGYYIDSPGTTSEFIIPEDELSDMVGGTISKVTFYISGTPQSWGSPVVQVYLGNATTTTLSSVNGPTVFTVVYTGTVSNQSSTIEIVFNEPYTYEGGNLLIGTYVQSEGTYKRTYFYGVSAPSGSSYCDYSYGDASPSFLPKTTFTYEPAQTGGDVCEKPATCEYSNLTATSATLSWTGGSGTYNVEVKGGEWADWTAILTNTALTTTTLTLQPTTSYQARVQSVCTGTTPTSGWKTSASFSTPCGETTLPYFYGFEDASPLACWTMTDCVSNTGRYQGTANTDSYCFRFYYGYNDQFLISPELSGTGNGVYFSFYYRQYSSGTETFHVGYSTTTNSTDAFTWGDEMTATTSYQLYENVFPAGTKYVAIKLTSYYQYYLYIDDVNLTLPPTCYMPTAAQVDEYDQTTATISWVRDTRNADGETYSILMVREGDDDLLLTTSTTPAVSISGSTASLTGLTQSTPYSFKVVTNCANTEENVDFVPLSFTTLASCPVPSNLNVAANSITAHAATLTWMAANDSYNITLGEVAYIVNATFETGDLSQAAFTNDATRPWSVVANDYSGAFCAKSGNGGVSSSNSELTLVVTVENDKTLTFSAKVSSESGYDKAYFYIDDEAKINGISGNGNWIDYSFPLTAGTHTFKWRYSKDSSTDSYDDCFYVDDITITNGVSPIGNYTSNTTSYTFTGLDGETTYGVQVQGVCGGEPTAWSEVYNFTTTVACPVPTGLAIVGDATANSVDLTWTAGAVNQDNWQICLNGDEENPIDVNNATIEGTTVTYTLTGLTSGADYSVKVRANCGDVDGVSDWSNPVSFTTEASCTEPSAFDIVENSIQAHQVQLSWTAGDDETAWDIYYSEENVAPANGGDATVTGITNNPYILSGLTDARTYYVWVRAHCGDAAGQQSPWVGPVSFSTPQEAVTAPYADDFESGNNWLLVNGNLTNAWAYGEAVNNGGTHALYISNDGGTTNAYTNNSSTMVYATKLITFEEGTYKFSYDWKANGESTYDYLRVALVPATTTLTAGTSVPTGFGTTTLPTGCIALDGGGKLNLNSDWQSFASNEMEVAAGTYMMVFAWRNDYMSGSNPPAAIDNVSIEKITCIAPTALAASNVTAHAATLGWTAGADEEAWQIAYSTTADFNPDDVTPVEVTNNPVITISGLENNNNNGQTYYAYVRANCGEDGYSNWSNRVNFTTLNGALAPTNLVVSNLASTTATISWNRAASNDLHESYKLYYSKLSSMPETLNEDSLFTGVTATTHDFVNLESEVTYYVWVRDICGTDGESDWTSTSFTTLPSCPTPTDLTATNITNNAATISWTGSSDVANYTVQYRTAAYMDGITEEFNGNNIPTGWTMYTGMLNDNTATLSSATYGWSFGSNNGVFDSHARVNIYSNYQRWLVTPATTLPANATLNFDIALTAYSGALSAPETNGTDDKFIVLISNDEKATWTTLREWNNSGSPYVYNEIANTATGENVNIDLSVYNGQTVYIAFYGESTESNADNNLHIDNVAIGTPVAEGDWQDATTNVAEQSYTITGLDAETKYDVQVKSNCTNGEYSAPYPFTTASVFTKSIQANKWYAIATPAHDCVKPNDAVALTNVLNLTTADHDLYSYDEANGSWMAASDSLMTGTGYIYRRSNDATLQFVGYANTGSVSVSLTSSSTTDPDLRGFNLIGNPYPHAVEVGRAFYTLKPEGTWMAKTSGDTITAAEACLVQTTYSSTTYTFYDVTPTPSKSSSDHAALAFTVSNDEFEDVAYARFDNGEGLPKIGHLAANAPMLSIPVEGRRYAIANLGSDCESFDMVFRGTGTYTLSFNGNTGYCHLIDRVAGKEIDMLRQNYTFSSNGFDADRFTVKLSPDAQENAGSNFAYWNGNVWMVEGNGTLQVFDALGRQLLSQEINNSNFEIQNSLFPAAGVYVLRMGEKTQKIVVR